MRTETPRPIRLVDYRPPAFLIEAVALDFVLEPSATRVKARLDVRRNGTGEAPLVLDGANLTLVSAAIDGVAVAPDRLQVGDDTLTIAGVPDSFVLETEVEIDPAGNTALEGLYMSGGRFCTQCEAEGFRKITFYTDRPDVMSRFTVRMSADKAAFPRLLANGNLIEAGDLDGGRHYAVWEDPFPKPAYLFALVAGELDVLEDAFTTMSGREIALRVFVDPGMSGRAAYAMDALKRSMRWDEEAYGREYDLDLFMIVAVRDFNFGAMENKGLNIFNSSLLLADPQTATDADYERIEAVVAHEYFHNWTGNRITCRDWFQLCLKEGLTVFRDQGFSESQRGQAVQRIKQVRTLRARQIPEDAGPLAHPVRPSSYLKIDNFYTATIYEKGAEIIRMLKTLVGDDDFRRGMDLYFERCDGAAVTVEAFISAFESASGRDLTAFFGWYEQAGTPRLTIETAWDQAGRALDITLRQQTAPTPGQPDKRALPIPVRIGLLNDNGAAIRFTFDGSAGEEALVVLDGASRTVRFEDVASRPVVSALRGFSAPVNLTLASPDDDAFLQLASDPDPFNRWEAGQKLAEALIMARAKGAADADGEARFSAGFQRSLRDPSIDDAFKALLLVLPDESDLALAMSPGADPAAIHAARQSLKRTLATNLAAGLEALHDSLAHDGAFSPDAASAGRRALRNAVLDLIVAGGGEPAAERARDHYKRADNMTDAMGGLNALAQAGGEAFDAALADFHARWKSEPLVLDKWFAVQARAPGEATLGRVLGLSAHPDFDHKTPNRWRALVQTLALANPAVFHHESGAGYRFITDQIVVVDRFNPMTAARLVEALGGWRRYRPELGALMRAQLQRLVDAPGVSKNVLELASRAID